MLSVPLYIYTLLSSQIFFDPWIYLSLSYLPDKNPIQLFYVYPIVLCFSPSHGKLHLTCIWKIGWDLQLKRTFLSITDDLFRSDIDLHLQSNTVIDVKFTFVFYTRILLYVFVYEEIRKLTVCTLMFKYLT